MTEPDELITFPKRTIQNVVLSDFFSEDCTIISCKSFEAPIILVGLTALSVDITTTFLTFVDMAASQTDLVPKILFLIPLKYSHNTQQLVHVCMLLHGKGILYCENK